MGAETLAPVAGTSMVAIMAPAIMAPAIMAPAGTVAPAGMADIGVILGTDMDGAGDGALASGGRIGAGDGDTHMATTATARGITLLSTLSTTRTIVLRVIHVRPTGTVTLHQIAAPDREAIRPSLGDRR